MRIEYIRLKNFKRFKLANIKDFEATFPEAITVIIAESGKGKSSLLSQLNPLPAVRTDFDKDGYKEIRISHEGHQYTLIADFSNRNNPHSFICDGEELNVSHTTEIQNDLVRKHFSISNLLYNLMYNKVALTRTTASSRRDLFLSLNPLDLSLVIETHKKVNTKLRDSKANVQMLEVRKSELEQKLLAPEVLSQHKETQSSLINRKRQAEQFLYTVNQHLASIRREYSSSLEYYKSRSGDVIPTEEVEKLHHELYYKLQKFLHVARGSEFYTTREKLHGSIESLNTKMSMLETESQGISRKIDEYRKHLEMTSSNPISKLESEISSLDKEISVFTLLPETPLPEHKLSTIRENLNSLIETELLIVEAGVKLDTPDKVHSARDKYMELKYQRGLQTSRLQSAISAIETIKAELTKTQEDAHIPEECPGGCGLREMFKNSAHTREIELTRQIEIRTSAETYLNRTIDEFNKLKEYLVPYSDYKLITRMESIRNWVGNYLGISYSFDELVDILNSTPTKLSQMATNLLNQSEDYYRYQKLLDRRAVLVTELEATVKSTEVSTSFVTQELHNRERELTENLSKLREYQEEVGKYKEEYDNYLDYERTLDKVLKLQKECEEGYKALQVNKACEFWEHVASDVNTIIIALDEELRELDSLVREQDSLLHTYQDEILVQLKKISYEKRLYEKLEKALSPTQGLPYKSMLRYMNVLINNVNYFIGQIWSYPLVIKNYVEGDKLDYTLGVKVGCEISKDISQLSDGQAEVVNLCWVVAILLQLKLLNKIPFYADEITRCMDNYHRTKTVEFLNSLLQNQLIEQCFIINHFVSVSEGFKDSNIICLSPDNLTDIPDNANRNVTMVPY